MNVSKYFKLNRLALQSQIIKSRPKSWINPSLRMFSTEARDYFKQVLVDGKPRHQREFDLQHEVQVTQEHANMHKEKAQAVINSSKHKLKHGVKDYEVSDYRVDGSMLETPNYQGIVKGEIPTDRIEMSRTRFEPINVIEQLVSEMDVAVFNLPYDITREKVFKMFTKYGAIEHIEI
jgi:hypothetical protein